MFKEYVKLKDATNRVGLALPSISSCGNNIYVVYSGGTIGAEFFKNSHGTLISIGVLPLDSNFPNVNSGYADHNFNKFTLIDYNSNSARIRLFDKNFNLISQQIFNNGLFGEFLGGIFSLNNKYIALTTVTQIQNPQISTLYVLNSKNLEIVATTTFETHTNGPVFFEHKGKTFISIACGNPSGHPGPFSSPCALLIYKLNKNNTIKLIDDKPLPQFPRVNAILNHTCDKQIIGVGTQAAFLIGEKGLKVNNDGFTSYLPNDGNELRLYEFDGHKLSYLSSQNPNVSILPLAFNDKLNLMAVGYVNEQLAPPAPDPVTGAYGFLSLYHIDNNEIKILQSDTAIPYFPLQSYFSQNGKWLILGGLNETTPDYNNVLLYKIHISHIKTK